MGLGGCFTTGSSQRKNHCVLVVVIKAVDELPVSIDNDVIVTGRIILSGELMMSSMCKCMYTCGGNTDTHSPS